MAMKKIKIAVGSLPEADFGILTDIINRHAAYQGIEEWDTIELSFLTAEKVKPKLNAYGYSDDYNIVEEA